MKARSATLEPIEREMREMREMREAKGVQVAEGPRGIQRYVIGDPVTGAR